eukprot:CAMPEP_0115108040 /NCGR_PEP_ID=MMETSP0227-20121206/37714_1 /TAXON_ID=89957 /ORGANISM="Polarella glacialis, Strain CCMP 1383" /LENGTH=53 /DNA_ID=CAMNT_0002506153 /DNA_START=23 /DNA_END=181 /DNA_ORIENTATION=+
MILGLTSSQLLAQQERRHKVGSLLSSCHGREGTVAAGSLGVLTADPDAPVVAQ